MFSFLLDILVYIGVELLGQTANAYLAFKELANCFPMYLHHLHPHSNVLEFQFFTSMSTLAIVCLFYCSQSDGFEVVCCYGFDF